jgi:hypothetical protein
LIYTMTEHERRARMPAEQCPQGHEIRSAADRDGQGYCKACRRDGARQRRVSQSMKLTLVKAFEDVGIRFEDDDGAPVAPAEVVRQIVAVYESGIELPIEL